MNLATGPTVTLDAALAHATRLLDTDPALAGEQAAEVLRVVAGHPVAELIHAAALTACDRAGESLPILEALARSQPRSPRTRLELGLALARLGRGEEAVAVLRGAVAMQPDLPTAWVALADLLRAQGDVAGAEAALVEHVRHAARDPELMQAAGALAAGRLPEVEPRLEARLRRLPDDVAALRMSAELHARQGLVELAEEELARCVRLAPGFLAARHNYAMLLHRAGKSTQALAEAGRLLEVEPANPAFRNLKAVVLCRMGDYAPALELFDRLLAEAPRNPSVWMSYGHALKTSGDTDRAIDAYRRGLAVEPAFGECWWSLANLKTFRFSDDDVAAMRAAEARPGLADEHRLHLGFALGKALEDRGDHAAAFASYARGNEVRRAQLRYRADETTARVRHAIARYTPEFFAARAGMGDPSPDPIFIVGLPRAGSTLLEQILSSHSQVEGTMELPDVPSITRELREAAAASDPDMPYHEALARLDADGLRALGAKYLEGTRLHRREGKPLFIDKMPNNFMHLGLIHLMLPNAKVIDARRHPLACGFSLFKQHFARGQSFAYSLEDIGRYYRDYVELMAHFDAVLPGRVHRVIHEDLVGDTEARVRALLDYCGLPFEDACLRPHENTRAVRTASSEQVRRPINRDGLDQWRHFAPWLKPLEDALGPVLAAYPRVPDEFETDPGRRRPGH
jgi:tetratricopeptide (TPR) repeat protein